MRFSLFFVFPELILKSESLKEGFADAGIRKKAWRICDD